MAKRAAPGRVKTRLIGPYTPEQAAEVHAAMLACVLARAAAHLPGPRVLAVAGEGDEAPIVAARDAGWAIVDQGGGNLGARLERVWRALGGGPATFLGVDSPDVPAAALAAVGPALATHDAAVGPAYDGGYWTLSARRVEPALLRGIDWGTPAVYDQTSAAARSAGLSLASLPLWHDVDEPGDLRALRRRLASAGEPALATLREHLRTICENSDHE